MDREADRHGEEEEEGGIRKEKQGVTKLLDGIMPQTVQAEESHLICFHLVLLFYFLTSSPPSVSLQPLGFAGSSGEAVYSTPAHFL